MTLRSAGFVTEPITGPRSVGVAAPQRIGKRAAAVPGSGCEVSRMWVWRLGVFMGDSRRGIKKAPRSHPPREPVSPRLKYCASAPEDRHGLSVSRADDAWPRSGFHLPAVERAGVEGTFL